MRNSSLSLFPWLSLLPCIALQRHHRQQQHHHHHYLRYLLAIIVIINFLPFSQPLHKLCGCSYCKTWRDKVTRLGIFKVEKLYLYLRLRLRVYFYLDFLQYLWVFPLSTPLLTFCIACIMCINFHILQKKSNWMFVVHAIEFVGDNVTHVQQYLTIIIIALYFMVLHM